MLAFVSAALLAAVPLQPCEVQSQKAECGTIPVPENREHRVGRMVDLYVAVIRSAPGKQTTDAVFILAGGPGQAATSLTDYAAERFAAAERDIVLLDARGTGRSNGLHCDFGGDDEHVSEYFNDFLPIDAVAACRKALEPRADLKQYTTTEIAEDVEEARKRLGYETVNLYGTSYGTRAAQEYMRRYPKRVRLAILDGVVPPSLIAPAPYAQNAQRSLEGVFAFCESDSACRAAYPTLRADYQSMLERVANGVDVTVEDPKTHKVARFRISRGLFGEVFRNFLYTPEKYVRVPGIVRKAAQGDFTEFGETALSYARSIRTLDFGMFLSVSCAEDFPRLSATAARKEAEGTLLGSYRVDQQVAACKGWPREAADPQRYFPVRASMPTLLISGEFDPVTPPQYAAEVARTLPNSLQVIVPKGSHYEDTGGCLEKIIVTAVKSGTVSALDVSCVRSVPSPKFLLE